MEIKINSIYLRKGREVEITGESTVRPGHYYYRYLDTNRNAVRSRTSRAFTLPKSYANYKPVEIKEAEMAKKESSVNVQELVDRYNSIEDPAAKAKMRRQLRKDGIYLSKLKADNPAPKADKKKEPAPLVKTPPREKEPAAVDRAEEILQTIEELVEELRELLG